MELLDKLRLLNGINETSDVIIRCLFEGIESSPFFSTKKANCESISVVVTTYFFNSAKFSKNTINYFNVIPVYADGMFSVSKDVFVRADDMLSVSKDLFVRADDMLSISNDMFVHADYMLSVSKDMFDCADGMLSVSKDMFDCADDMFVISKDVFDCADDVIQRLYVENAFYYQLNKKMDGFYFATAEQMEIAP